jgi:hypothetical protein
MVARMRDRNAAFRVLFIVLFVCAMVGAQAFTLAWDHPHQSSEHCCGLCHAGPLPFVQPSISTNSTPTLETAWLVWAPELQHQRETLPGAGSSRAPPA